MPGLLSIRRRLENRRHVTPCGPAPWTPRCVWRGACSGAGDGKGLMPDTKPRWRVVCSCGWERESVSEWAAESVSRLHQQLGVLGVEHATTIEGPDGPNAEQHPLV